MLSPVLRIIALCIGIAWSFSFYSYRFGKWGFGDLKDRFWSIVLTGRLADRVCPCALVYVELFALGVNRYPVSLYVPTTTVSICTYGVLLFIYLWSRYSGRYTMIMGLFCHKIRGRKVLLP